MYWGRRILFGGALLNTVPVVSLGGDVETYVCVI